MQIYDIGDVAVLSASFTNKSGALTDPSTISLSLQAANDPAPTLLSYPADIARAGTGQYTYTFTPTRDGLYSSTWTGTGSVETAESDTFYVRRAALSALRVRVLALIGGDLGELTDMDVDIALERHRVDVFRQMMETQYFASTPWQLFWLPWPQQRGIPDPWSPNFPGFTFNHFRHPWRLNDWSLGVVLEDLAFAAVTPSGSDIADLVQGRWTFAANRTMPQLYVSGSSYDPYAAAADLCEQRAATQTSSYDISDSGQMLRRSQLTAQWQQRAELLRKRARRWVG